MVIMLCKNAKGRKSQIFSGKCFVNIASEVRLMLFSEKVFICIPKKPFMSFQTIQIA